MTSRESSSLSEYYRLPPILPNAESYKHYLEAVCNNATVALFIMDERQHCVYMNAAAEQLTGYTLSEAQGRALHDVIHHTRPDGRPYPLCECPIDQAFPQNNQEQGEEVFVHKEGYFYSVAYTASPIRETSGVVGTIIEVRDITQDKLDEIAQREAAEALRQSEERFRQFSENVKDVFWITDLRTPQLLYINSAYERIWQRPREQLYQNYNWLETVHPDDQDFVQSALSHALVDGYEIDYRIVRPDGSIRWIRDRGFAIPESNGEPYRMAGIAEDITERKQIETALRHGEQRYRSLIEATAQIIWNTQGEQGEISTPQPDWSAFTGQTFEEAKGWGWLNAIHPDDQAITTQAWLTALTHRTLYEVEHRLRRHDGVYRYMNVRAVPVFEEDGTVREWIGVHTDISDRKQAEQEREQVLARERHYMNQLQGLTRAALAINSALSVEDVLRVITDQAAAIIGAHQSVTSLMINQDWAQPIDAVYLSDKYAQWRDYGEQPNGSGIDTYACRLNRPMRMTQAELETYPGWRNFGVGLEKHPPMRGWLAAPLMGRDGQNIGLIQLSDKCEGDFTEADEAILVQLAQMASVAVENARLYEAEQQARAAAEASREQAQAANRIKDEFLAVLSHELRTPMNPILGWSKLLRSGRLDSTRMTGALESIERNAQLQAQLIDDLLDISRILRGKLTLTIAPVNLRMVILAALETVRLAADAKALKIQTQISTSVGFVHGDAGRLQQVVWNLLSNAVKFTPEGGLLFVELDQDSSHATIQIRDTGKGISPAFLPYVFEHFRQEDGATTRKFGGLGLGLAIARQIVELHGGTIHAESQGEGQGATFTVKLPIITASKTPAKCNSPACRSLSECPLQGIRVLAVDDEMDSLTFVAFVLEQAGAEVKMADSGIEALNLLPEFAPDVLLSDIGMPAMDGYMLIQQVRQSMPNRRITAIALTAYAGELDQQRAVAAGFQQHISKPVDPDRLVSAITALCSGSLTSK
jgi:PAS domain S-box-containing protein